MITVISPAKKLSSDYSAADGMQSTCEFLDPASTLVKILKKFQPDILSDIMNISENLSILNWERYQNWSIPFHSDSARQAMYTFTGDTYTGFDIATLSKADIKFCQQHTRILSGLYGLLRPMDLIMPYRLEMGTRLNNEKGEDLYSFWRDMITKTLNKELISHKQKVIINCASVEYFKVVNLNKLTADVVIPVFKEIKNGKPKIVSFFAKKARGAMARYIVQNRIEIPAKIRDFDQDGYRYNSSLSTVNMPVFTR